MQDYFLDSKNNELCIITKLSGKSVNELLCVDDDLTDNDLSDDEKIR